MTGPPGAGRLSTFAERNADQFGRVLLLVVVFYALGSLLPYSGWQGVLLSVVGCVTAGYALAVAGIRDRFLRIVLTASALVVAGAAASALADTHSIDGLASLLLSLLFLFAALAVLRAVVTEDQIGVGAIAGAISVYIMLGFLFAFVYLGLDKLQTVPFFGAGTHVQEGDFFFFSMTTLTTTGYGNLVPAIQPGRMLSALEMLTGQIFVVTLIARLVTAWQPGEWLRSGAGITRRRRSTDS